MVIFRCQITKNKKSDSQHIQECKWYTTCFMFFMFYLSFNQGSLTKFFCMILSLLLLFSKLVSHLTQKSKTKTKFNTPCIFCPNFFYLFNTFTFFFWSFCTNKLGRLMTFFAQICPTFDFYIPWSKWNRN